MFTLLKLFGDLNNYDVILHIYVLGLVNIGNCRYSIAKPTGS